MTVVIARNVAIPTKRIIEDHKENSFSIGVFPICTTMENFLKDNIQQHQPLLGNPTA